jgi:hypothetical protein
MGIMQADQDFLLNKNDVVVIPLIYYMLTDWVESHAEENIEAALYAYEGEITNTTEYQDFPEGSLITSDKITIHAPANSSAHQYNRYFTSDYRSHASVYFRSDISGKFRGFLLKIDQNENQAYLYFRLESSDEQDYGWKLIAR